MSRTNTTRILVAAIGATVALSMTACGPAGSGVSDQGIAMPSPVGAVSNAGG